MRVQIQCHRHDVQIAGPFAVAEKSSFDTVRARDEREFGRGHGGAAAIVRVN